MILGFGYGLLAIAIVAFELSRRKELLFDQLSIVTGFFLGYLVIPPAILHLVLDSGFVEVDRIADFSLMGYLQHRAEPLQNFIHILGCTAAYAGLVLGFRLIARQREAPRPAALATRARLQIAWVAIGLGFVALMFVFGNTLTPGDPFGGLLLSTYYRAEDRFYAFERTPLNANIYSATSTFLFFSVLGYALADERRRLRFLFLAFTVVFLGIDVLAAGARRNLLIAAVLIYLYVAARKGRYKLQNLLVIVTVSVPLLFFGKVILRNMSDIEGAAAGFADISPLEQMVGATADIGQSYLETIGTLSLYDGGPRLGMDHVYSVLRLLPMGMLGFEEPWPERIVRISTAYQSGDPGMQDIPPGYLGQCWIDLPFAGFFLIPLLHGIGAGLVERGFRGVDLRRSPFYLMAFVVAGFLVAMPLNTGTLDYLCSPEIVLTVLLFFLLHYLNTGCLALPSVRLRVSTHATTHSSETAPAASGPVPSLPSRSDLA